MLPASVCTIKKRKAIEQNKKPQIRKESEAFLSFVIVLRIENVKSTQFISRDIGELV